MSDCKPRVRSSRINTVHQNGQAPSNVAVCFVGQFIRHQMMEGNIQQKFGAADASSSISYSAFVASSTQHDEMKPNDVVNGDELCSALINHGFKECKRSLETYNPAIFAAKSEGLEFQSENGIFPFRSASFFSTISRCIDLIIEEDENNTHYDAIVMTRLDVMNVITPLNPSMPSSTWWKRAMSYDMVGAKRMPGLLDDRFFLGKRAVMLKFKEVYNKFNSLYTTKINSPERMLYSFAHRTTPSLKLAPIAEFIVFQEFEVNNNKYSPLFKSFLENQLGMESSLHGSDLKSKADRTKACAHIHSPLAHNKCMELD